MPATDIKTMEADLKAQIEQVGKAIADSVEGLKTASADEQKALGESLESLKSRFDKLEEKLAGAERMHVPGVEIGKNAETGKWSWGRFMQIVTGIVKNADGKFKDHGYEFEVLEAAQKGIDDLDDKVKFAINAGTGATGAFLIPTEVNQELIPEIEAAMIASQLGVRTVSGLQGNVTWTRDEGGMSAEYIDTEAEETGAESKPTFSQQEIRPHVLAAFVPMSWSMLTQPAIALESWVRSRIAMKIALRKDKSIFKGLAALKEPRGITNDPDILAAISFSGVTFDGASQNVTDKLMDMFGALAAANTLNSAGKLGFAAEPGVVTKFGKSKDADGNPLFFTHAAGQAVGRLSTLYGYPLRESTQLDVSTSDGFLLFGDFATVMDANWGNIVFASSAETETNFRKLRTTVRAVTAHDVGMFQAKAFVPATAITTT